VDRHARRLAKSGIRRIPPGFSASAGPLDTTANESAAASARIRNLNGIFILPGFRLRPG
jgi:hypothetical protein